MNGLTMNFPEITKAIEVEYSKKFGFLKDEIIIYLNKLQSQMVTEKFNKQKTKE